MKKTLVFVLLLGLVGAFVFAQDAPALKFNGYMNFGAQINNDGTNTNLIALGSDSWQIGRFQLEGKYAASNWGWAFRMRNDVAFTTKTPSLYLARVWGWVDALNGMVTVKAGKLDDYSWASNNWSQFGNFDGTVGIQLQLKPVAGLNFGVFLPTMLNGTDTNLASDAFSAITIGGMYSMDNMGYVSLGYRLGNTTNGQVPYFWAGLGYTGMSALTAKAEMKLNNDPVAANNYFYVNEQLGYDMAPLNVNLWAEQQFNSSSPDGTNMILHFQPSVDYTMGSWNLGAFFSFLTDSTSSGYGPGIWAKATVADGATVAFGGEYDLGTAVSNTQQSAGMATNVTGNYDPIGGTYGTSALDTQANNQFRAYVDFVWKF
jgi:hypothetical protein